MGAHVDIAPNRARSKADMNTKYLLALSALLTVGLLCIAPVSAEQVVISSDVSPSFSMSMVTSDVSFPLTVVGTNDLTTGNTVTVNSNVGFTIKARDAFTTAPPGSPAGSTGHLKSLIPPDTLTGKMLADPLQVALNGGSYVPLSGADQTIHAASAGSFSQPLKLRQVTSYADEVLPAGQVYRIAVIVTGAANP